MLFEDNDFVKSTACSHCKNCLAVANKDGIVAVRDTKDLSTLQFSLEEWRAFVAGVKKGEFDFL